jgi:hypothetical protein
MRVCVLPVSVRQPTHAFHACTHSSTARLGRRRFREFWNACECQSCTQFTSEKWQCFPSSYDSLFYGVTLSHNEEPAYTNIASRCVGPVLNIVMASFGIVRKVLKMQSWVLLGKSRDPRGSFTACQQQTLGNPWADPQILSANLSNNSKEFLLTIRTTPSLFPGPSPAH